MEKAFAVSFPITAASSPSLVQLLSTGHYHLGFIFIFLNPHKQAY